MRCPHCDDETDVAEDDLIAQAAHMHVKHPDIIAERQRKAARFDGWENE